MDGMVQCVTSAVDMSQPILPFNLMSQPFLKFPRNSPRLGEKWFSYRWAHIKKRHRRIGLESLARRTLSLLFPLFSPSLIFHRSDKVFEDGSSGSQPNNTTGTSQVCCYQSFHWASGKVVGTVSWMTPYAKLPRDWKMLSLRTFSNQDKNCAT